MTQEKTRILVVDDEPRYRRMIKLILEANQYEVVDAENGQQAVDIVSSEPPELVLLDIRMPVMDGFEACRRIRDFSMIPIIMLTARAEEEDIVKGLDAGADDYITKPFGADELKARVKSVLRRATYSEQIPSSSIDQIGGLKIDYVHNHIWVDEVEIQLTSTEYRLLSELARQAGRVLTPDQLLERVWGRGYEGEVKLVWQIIYRLRKKIEPDPNNPNFIQNKPGIGYFLVKPEE